MIVKFVDIELNIKKIPTQGEIMKKLTLLLTLLFSLSLFAKNSELVMECEQLDDADQWISVEVSLNDGPGYVLEVFENNYDDGSKTAIFAEQVFESKCQGKLCYENSSQTAKLDISSDQDGFLIGNLSILADGPNDLVEEKMNCISYGE
jgi:hypothetical protein